MSYPRITNSSSDIASAVKDLKKGSVLRVEGNRSGQSICCLNGTVWITQQGDYVDRVLNIGERYLTNLPSYVLIGALNDARIKICPEGKPHSNGWFPRIWHRILTNA